MSPTNGFKGGSGVARLRAAGIHFGLSLTAVGLLALSMLLIWYPPPYFMADGGWRVLRIIILVDVVLGPLLTLIVFDRAKPELKRDLAVIALLQVGAFGYGAATMFLYRPAFVAVVAGNPVTVNWPDLSIPGADLAPARALAAGGARPTFAHVRLPESPAERAALWRRAAQGGVAPMREAARFEAMTPAHYDALFRLSVDIEALAQGDASVAAELARVLRSHPEIPRARMAFIPLTCRFDLIMLVFDRERRVVVDWMT